MQHLNILAWFRADQFISIRIKTSLKVYREIAQLKLQLIEMMVYKWPILCSLLLGPPERKVHNGYYIVYRYYTNLER